MFFLPSGYLPLQKLQWRLYCRYWQTANTRTLTWLYWAFLARTLGLPSGCLNLFIVKRNILKINGRIKIRLNLYAHYELVEGEGAIPLPVLWWAPIRAKQLSMAATVRVIWLCTCVRYWPDGGLVYVCPLLKVCLTLSEPTFPTFLYKMIVNYFGVDINK